MVVQPKMEIQGVALHIFENIGVEYGYVLDYWCFFKESIKRSSTYGKIQHWWFTIGW